MKIDKTRFILTGSIREFVFFCQQVDKPPAWFRPLLTKEDVKRIPIGSIIILYGTYHKSPINSLIQQAWEDDLIHVWVITPDEVTAEHDI